mmetsp:Transcript_3202/g.5895  ORF Transcript_3202/g.5895 Transcript_3202/m.5895 type:complete len:776 (-) Transcript_3202:38-2365(-)
MSEPKTDDTKGQDTGETAAPASSASNDETAPQPKAKKQPQKPKEPEREWTPELQQDLDRILSVGEECISEPELKSLLLAKGRGSSLGFNLYDGFEPSGRMHIAQGVFKAMNVNKCTFPESNGTFVFWVADWFALMNDKIGGNLEKIQVVGSYLIEVWKAAGMNLDHVVFKWASEEITHHANTYWPLMLDVARRFNITRIKKCCQIMGRMEGSLTSAQVLYPLMQCTDVFFLKADICQLGVDQRKVNMLAREYCDAARIKRKPVILSHHMLYGLRAGQEKMSKSDPDSAVFMEDSAEDVERKIMNAYCPNKEELTVAATTADADRDDADAGKQSMHLKVDTLKNPCLDYIQNIIFSPPGSTFTAGDKTYTDFETVREAFLAGIITEDELKRGLIAELNRLLEPVRTHFATDENAKGLFDKVKQYKKESLDTTEKTIRKLDLVSLGKAPAASHVAFAPLPSANPTLQEAVDVIAQLRSDDSIAPKVLFLSDWTARVTNSCDADLKAISAYYTVLIASLTALDPDLMESVTVLYQSDAILADPSNYWISVINVGRHFMLNEVMGPDMKDSDGVGIVIGRLMMVADVMGLSPASVALVDSVDSLVEKQLITKFYENRLQGIPAPSVSLVLGPVMRLQPERESDAFKTENDEYFLLDDPKVHGKSKMKKAFCEPGNVGFCPPIAVACALTFGFNGSGDGEITVKRSEDNGGDVTYKNRADIESDFANGDLHPGDLKAASTLIMVSTLDKLSSGIKSDGDVTKASKALKAYQKKAAKKTKK